MSFPRITHISQFDDILKNKEEIVLKKEIVDGEEISIISYMVSMPTTFDSPLARECRGITFNAKGELISRPFHKFFNVGEKECSQPDKVKWNKVSLITNKWDGSLVVPVNVNNKVFWKTKKTFYSDQIKQMTDEKLITDALNWCGKSIDGTYMFEYISPNNRIVIDYPEPTLKLLMRRHMLTGDYITGVAHSDYAIIKAIQDNGIKDIYAFIDYVKKLTGIEGYVIWDGEDFFKIKTQWYLDRHHALDTISMRDVIDLILNEQIDDVTATIELYDMKVNSIIAPLIQEVNQSVIDIIKTVTAVYQSIIDANGKDRKAIADIVFKNHAQYAGMIFGLYDNKDIVPMAKRIVANNLKQKYKNRIITIGERI